MDWDVSPWLRAFWEERCFPAGVRGPVEWWAFSRLIVARRTAQARTLSPVLAGSGVDSRHSRVPVRVQTFYLSASDF